MDENKKNLVLLKLGGSLITYKDQPKTARRDIIRRIMQEISLAKSEQPNLQIILGHGSGSFGHSVGKKYGTRNGVKNDRDWDGFYQVYAAARELNQLVFTSAQQENLPVIPFPLCSNATVENQNIKTWNLSPLEKALEHGFIPLVYGDVAFDLQLGGTILSTEEIFTYLNTQLHPQKILLAGIEPGIWQDYPQNTIIINDIQATTWQKQDVNLEGSGVTDVTGGMKSKVESMLEIIKDNLECEILIFSGLEPESITSALSGNNIGTLIRR